MKIILSHWQVCIFYSSYHRKKYAKQILKISLFLNKMVQLTKLYEIWSGLNDAMVLHLSKFCEFLLSICNKTSLLFLALCLCVITSTLEIPDLYPMQDLSYQKRFLRLTKTFFLKDYKVAARLKIWQRL